LEDPGVEGRIILKSIYRSGMGGMNWIYLALDRDRWLTVMNAVMNLWVALNAGNSLNS
jgi:hypothetical protein